MHSSRIRTGRSLTVCWRLLPGGGVCLVGGGSAWSGGACLVQGGSLVQGGLASQHALRQTPPLWTESQTLVKTLPWPNFVAAGNKVSYGLVQWCTSMLSQLCKIVNNDLLIWPLPSMSSDMFP